MAIQMPHPVAAVGASAACGSSSIISRPRAIARTSIVIEAADFDGSVTMWCSQ